MGSTVDQERAWQQSRRYRRWNETGGPGDATRWAYEHPGAVTALVAVAGVAVAVGVTVAFGADLRPWVGAVVLPATVGWQLRTGRAHLEEWERADGDRREDVADDHTGTISPMGRRYLTGRVVVLGIVLVVLVVAVVVGGGGR